MVHLQRASCDIQDITQRMAMTAIDIVARTDQPPTRGGNHNILNSTRHRGVTVYMPPARISWEVGGSRKICPCSLTLQYSQQRANIRKYSRTTGPQLHQSLMAVVTNGIVRKDTGESALPHAVPTHPSTGPAQITISLPRRCKCSKQLNGYVNKHCHSTLKSAYYNSNDHANLSLKNCAPFLSSACIIN